MEFLHRHAPHDSVIATIMTKTKIRNPSAKPTKKHRKPAKLSRLMKPENLSIEEWQIELRRQFGREQKFKLKNLGSEPVFSDFQIANPASKSVYRVSIRGANPGDSFCSCPDFATNTLGTCKHMEFTLAKIQRSAGCASSANRISPSMRFIRSLTTTRFIAIWI